MLEMPSVYAANQVLGRPTTDRIRKLIAANVKSAVDQEILDLGCGVGAFRDCFSGPYTGIDINPAYMKQARLKNDWNQRQINGERQSHVRQPDDQKPCNLTDCVL